MELQTCSGINFEQEKNEGIFETVEREIKNQKKELKTSIPDLGQETTTGSEKLELEKHANEDISHCKSSGTEKDRRKGKPIPGFAREIILKVAAMCEQEAKNNFAQLPLNAPTKRAALYTGVSERTIQRIRNEDRKTSKRRKLDVDGDKCVDNNKKSSIKDHPDEESNYSTMRRKSKKGQTIPNSARDVISKVIDACDSEHRDGEYMVPLICKSKRTALYTGVSQRTVQRIKNEDEKRNKVNQEKVLITPGKTRKRSTFNDKIDDFDFHSIRMLIDDLVLIRKMSPSCATLHAAVKERISFPYSEHTLYRLLHSKGFIWFKGQKGKRALLEKPEVFRGRLDYLQRIKNYEEQGKFIVYLDERWIGRNTEDCYIDSKGIFGIKGGVCCSGRIVVLNEFSATGFIRRAQRLFKPNGVDAETNLDISTVEKWMKENLFPNIPPNSVIVMSTNSYKKEDNSVPNEYSTKPILVKFLKENNLKYNPGQTCSELYGIIKYYLGKFPTEWSEIDKIIEDHGHVVLRLPPYMSEFNPIEFAWADIKRYVRNENPSGNSSIKVLKEITLEAIKYFQNDTVPGYVNHVIRMEEYFWDKQKLIQQHYDHVTNSNGNSNNRASNATNITVLSNSIATNTSNNNCNVTLHDNMNKNSTMTFINPTLPSSSIVNNHAAIMVPNSYTPVLPHNQLGYVKNVATPVFDKSVDICENQLMDSGMIQAGPSYLNL